MTEKEIFEFLDQKAEEYNQPEFIMTDPIQIPHRFSLLQDVEIAGFLVAMIAWGNRKSILKSANKMLDFMGNSPYDFVMSSKDSDFENYGSTAVHRTFSVSDFHHFIKSLREIYSQNKSMENLFLLKDGETNFYHALDRFRTAFFQGDFSDRSVKHISSTYKGSAAKRLMMYLRWLVRKDKKGVDLGLWEQIDQRFLSVPLDVHTANISRQLGLITRKQNDWKTVEELDLKLRKYCPSDPAKYDFALFGLGITGELNN